MNVLMEKAGVEIWGGADVVPQYMTEELSKNGYDIYLLEGLNIYTDNRLDEDIFRFSRYNDYERGIGDCVNYNEVYKDVFSSYYDVIHSHAGSKRLSEINKKFKETYNTPLVHTIHGMSGIYEENDIEMMEIADLVTAPSMYTCEMAKEAHPWIEDKLLPVPNFTDYVNYTYNENISEKAENLKNDICKNGEKLVLFAGRLHEDKGVKELSDACVNLLDSGENIKLVYVGLDYYADGIKQYIADNFSSKGYQDKLMMRGEVDKDELMAWYKVADICVLPSDTQHETFGLTPLEALSMETPVIVSDIGGLKETYVDSGMGVGVKPRNAKSIEKGIGYTLQNYDYEKERAKVARDIISKWYSPETISGVWDKIYSKLSSEITLNSIPNPEDYMPDWHQRIKSYTAA